MVVLVTSKNEDDTSKTEGTRVVTQFSHYKSMGIFPDVQGQLTPQPEVGSGRISNLSQILRLSLLPARMRKIQSKIKALEWSQDYSLNFLTLKGS